MQLRMTNDELRVRMSRITRNYGMGLQVAPPSVVRKRWPPSTVTTTERAPSAAMATTRARTGSTDRAKPSGVRAENLPIGGANPAGAVLRAADDGEGRLRLREHAAPRRAAIPGLLDSVAPGSIGLREARRTRPLPPPSWRRTTPARLRPEAWRPCSLRPDSLGLGPSPGCLLFCAAARRGRWRCHGWRRTRRRLSGGVSTLERRQFVVLGLGRHGPGVPS